MKQSLAGLGLLALVVTGCVKEEGVVLAPATESAGTPTSATSSPPTVDPSQPQPLGTELDLTGFGAPLEATVSEINQNSAPTIMPPGGGHWASAQVEVCAKTDAPEPLTVGSSVWSATDGAGVVYNASTLTEVGFPRGLFPTASQLDPGSCARGWVMFPAGFQALLTRVTYTLDSAHEATWTAPVQ